MKKSINERADKFDMLTGERPRLSAFITLSIDKTGKRQAQPGIIVTLILRNHVPKGSRLLMKQGLL